MGHDPMVSPLFAAQRQSPHGFASTRQLPAGPRMPEASQVSYRGEITFGQMPSLYGSVHFHRSANAAIKASVGGRGSKAAPGIDFATDADKVSLRFPRLPCRAG
jgi:hypothetical protein